MEDQEQRPGSPEEQQQPYEPPGVDWVEPFDMSVNLASACGKISGQGGTCDTSPAS